MMEWGGSAQKRRASLFHHAPNRHAPNRHAKIKSWHDGYVSIRLRRRSPPKGEGRPTDVKPLPDHCSSGGEEFVGGAEELVVDAACRDAGFAQAGDEGAQEGARAAQEIVGFF
jgi:hypothetical protein